MESPTYNNNYDFGLHYIFKNRSLVFVKFTWSLHCHVYAYFLYVVHFEYRPYVLRVLILFYKIILTQPIRLVVSTRFYQPT